MSEDDKKAYKKLNKRTKEDRYLLERAERIYEKMEAFSIASEEKDAIQLAQVVNIPYIDLSAYPIDKDVLGLISEEEAKKSGMIPFYLGEKKDLRIGIVDPYNQDAAKIIKDLHKKKYTAKMYLISKNGFKNSLKLYRLIIKPKKEKRGEIGVSKEEYEKIGKEIRNLKDLKEKIESAPMTKIVNLLVAGAVFTDSSDIHMEPEEKDVKLRYRIDGILQDVATFSHEVYTKVVSRIKLLAGLKINISNIPQDGRFAINVGDKKIDLRVSILPTGYGETIVIRLLGTGTTGLKIAELGLRKRDQDILMNKIAQPNGMIITTGPTGSGKTTTLYSFLKQINTPEIKIITLENPIEYRLEGISQTQIDASAGMTFGAALRSVLRQDPDVVMVGEIRDLETADVAAQAALTGHIVFSTLHTNDSSGVIPRLVNMGLRPYTIAPALSGVIAQRLVRRLCNKCCKSSKPDKKTIEMLKRDLGKYYPADGVSKLYQALPKGCPACTNTGYKGRIGVYEVFEVNRKIAQLIDSRASSGDIMDAAKEQGMTTMRQDGLLKAIEGITSIDEVNRVTVS